ALSPFAGFGLPYGDIPSAGCLTGIGQINGLWCMFIANDATVKGGTAYPITVKKQAQGAGCNLHLLPWRSLLSLNGALMVVQLLYRQSEIFPERNHGGRTFYNEAVMSVAVVCGSCTVVGAYVPTMSEEAVIVHRIGTIFLGGPPLHSEVSGCADHFASAENEAYEYTRNIIATLNYELPEEDCTQVEEPLYNVDDLMGLAPRCYNHSMDVRLVKTCAFASIMVNVKIKQLTLLTSKI
uniref:Si:ch211-198n5.11 n=1 Tax=Sinocyclocheilus rhinocerous TaxID=307959 RepID=A0A673MWQ8_9TELE